MSGAVSGDRDSSKEPRNQLGRMTTGEGVCRKERQSVAAPSELSSDREGWAAHGMFSLGRGAHVTHLTWAVTWASSPELGPHWVATCPSIT
jgi:hypothetical protein